MRGPLDSHLVSIACISPARASQDRAIASASRATCSPQRLCTLTGSEARSITDGVKLLGLDEIEPF